MEQTSKAGGPALVLTPRDARLFSALARYGLLSTRQVESKVFRGVLAGTMLRRLRRLEEKGWIYRMRAMESGEHAWLLTRKAERALEVDVPMIRPNRNSIEHDVLLTELRLCLESVGLGENFVPEWSLRRQTFRVDKRGRPSSPIIPDGLFLATLWNKKSTTVALELELHAKTMHRYERIFTKYKEKESLGVLWYITRSESFARSLLTKWNAVEPSSWKARQGNAELIVSLLPELEAAPREARLFWPDGKTTPLSEFFHLTEAPKPIAEGVGRADASIEERETALIAS